ncbi:MAG: hypothetical protein KAS22_04650 [Candidatus Heimdallarchaeota archaeon]|nr:hypothetical protein [Candidatus Heimdallarchaeota archaeon]
MAGVGGCEPPTTNNSKRITSLFSLLGLGFQGLFLFDMVVVLSNLLSLVKISDNY